MFQLNNKRKRIFQTFCNSKFDIILLQETHTTDEQCFGEKTLDRTNFFFIAQ